MSWKAVGIVFIILFLVVGTSLVYIVYVGNESLNKENRCAIEICQDYDAYNFDIYENICVCYEGDTPTYRELM